MRQAIPRTQKTAVPIVAQKKEDVRKGSGVSAGRQEAMRNAAPPAANANRRALFAAAFSRASGTRGPAAADSLIQRAAAAPADRGAPPSLSGDSGGQPLAQPILTKMEKAFGSKFSDVRVHEGPQATRMGAVAYTQGNHIHFSPGSYNPRSSSGQELLGHELTHVVQQRSGMVRSPQHKAQDSVVINSDPALEREADSLGARAARGETVTVQGSTATGPIHPKLAAMMNMVIQRKVVWLNYAAAVSDLDRIIASTHGANAAVEDDAEAPHKLSMKFGLADYPHITDEGIAKYTALASKPEAYEKNQEIAIGDGDFETHELTPEESPAISKWYTSPGKRSIGVVARDGGGRGAQWVKKGLISEGWIELGESDPRHAGIHPEALPYAHYHMIKKGCDRVGKEDIAYLTAKLKGADPAVAPR